MTTTDSVIFNPNNLTLELDRTTVDRAWRTSQKIQNSFSRWQSYLNRVALDAFLPWLKAEEDATATCNSSSLRDSIWQLVNGTAIAIKNARLVLIPTEAEDKSELRVPQEWVDIPQWTADYYLAVQVNLDAGLVQIWGYATHLQLKNGTFDPCDRTYSLYDAELIRDLNVLWVARELCPDEVTQAAIEPIAELAPISAENLIQRLSNPSLVMPRLEVPFATWAALMQNSDWCRRLAAERNGISTRTPISSWIRGMKEITAEFGWRQIELTPGFIGARGTATSEATSVPIGLAKQLEIDNRPYELKILPQAEGAWRFELCCLTPGCMIPTGFKLRLLTEDLQGFEGNEDTALEPVEHLWLEVDLEPGESLVWQIEPTPNSDREILQF